MLLGGIGKCLLVLVIRVFVLRKLFLNRLYPLDKQLDLALFVPVLIGFRCVGYVLKLIRLGMREVERQLCAGRTDKLIQHA